MVGNIASLNHLGKPISVLVVDDHPTVRLRLKQLLAPLFEGCTFIEAQNGREALTMSFTHHPALVLMDIVMPEMDGIQAAAKIKSALPHVRIILYTGYGNAQFEARARAAGADALLVKEKLTADLLQNIIAPWFTPRFPSTERRDAS